MQDEVEKEVKILMDLKHSNIVKFYESGITKDGQLCIVMEKCSGTLNDLIGTQTMLNLGQVSFLARQIYSGLEYIHGKRVIHR